MSSGVVRTVFTFALTLVSIQAFKPTLFLHYLVLFFKNSLKSPMFEKSRFLFSFFKVTDLTHLKVFLLFIYYYIFIDLFF